jgi:hypothetical protein
MTEKAMNIYLITEDGSTFCIRAKTMTEAIKVCEANYLDDRKEEEGTKYNAEVERNYYHEEILQSCALVAELKN